MKRSALLAGIASSLFVLAVIPGPPTFAEDGNQKEARLISDKAGISLGGFLVDFTTEAAAGFGTVVGTVIRLEDDLSIDDSKATFRLGGFYRFGKRHALDVSFFDLNRRGATVIDEQIEFEGVLYDVGARVDSQFDIQLFRVSYRHSFVNNGKTEAGFAAGLSTYWFDLMLDGEATINEARQTAERVRAETDILAPVPTVGMFIHHAFTPKWILRMRAQFFDLDVGDFTGRLIDAEATMDYYFTRHFGIGLGLNTTDIRYEDNGDDPYSIDYRQGGLVWYLSGVF
jgi:hypothetical protein